MRLKEHIELVQDCLSDVFSRFNYVLTGKEDYALFFSNQATRIIFTSELRDTGANIVIEDSRSIPPKIYTLWDLIEFLGESQNRPIYNPNKTHPENFRNFLETCNRLFVSRFSDLLTGDFSRLLQDNAFDNYRSECAKYELEIVNLPEDDPIVKKCYALDPSWLEDIKTRFGER